MQEKWEAPVISSGMHVRCCGFAWYAVLFHGKHIIGIEALFHSRLFYAATRKAQKAWLNIYISVHNNTCPQGVSSLVTKF